MKTVTARSDSATLQQRVPAVGPRFAFVDNLKILLVAGVIVGHATMAWTGVGDWVFEEQPVRDPLLSILVLLSVLGALFAIPLFFMLAGAFTPPSLRRKGTSRFLVDRALRLGMPMLFFVIFLSPIVEYVDPENAGWSAGFGRFIPRIWWPPAPGPTWFLGVLLLFSVAYAVLRAVRTQRHTDSTRPSLWSLAGLAGAIALASYLVRLVVPLGVEVARLALGQAPAWIGGFVLGVLGGERGWLIPLEPSISRWTRRTAWVAMATCAAFVGAGIATGADIADFAGGGTWQSLVMAVLEGVIVVSASLWLMDLFRRRFDHQGPLTGEIARSAYPAFILHQVVLVGLVLATRLVPWPPEVEYLTVATAGVVASFSMAALVVRIPGLRTALGGRTGL